MQRRLDKAKEAASESTGAIAQLVARLTAEFNTTEANGPQLLETLEKRERKISEACTEAKIEFEKKHAKVLETL